MHPAPDPQPLRLPGRVCHTKIPSALKGALNAEKLNLLQSYKGAALLECRPCGYLFVAEVYEQADWSCPACSQRSFLHAHGRVTKVGGRVRGWTHARTDRRLGRHADNDQHGDVAA